ncbi:MAG TPA: STAS domain-containing protein [Terracidiphilus sp.]|jgi:anti-anti-sigma factor|nr:STAS domain-containing protein [Terracidiphilus sp.]
MSGTAPASFTTQIEYVDGIPVVVMAGRLEASNVNVFDGQIAPLLTQPHPRILIDMQALTFVASMGLRSILKLIKHAAASGGRAGAFAVPPMVLEVLEMTAFTKLMDVYPDRESALNAKGS